MRSLRSLLIYLKRHCYSHSLVRKLILKMFFMYHRLFFFIIIIFIVCIHYTWYCAVKGYLYIIMSSIFSAPPCSYSPLHASSISPFCLLRQFHYDVLLHLYIDNCRCLYAARSYILKRTHIYPLETDLIGLIWLSVVASASSIYYNSVFNCSQPYFWERVFRETRVYLLPRLAGY